MNTLRSITFVFGLIFVLLALLSTMLAVTVRYQAVSGFMSRNGYTVWRLSGNKSPKKIDFDAPRGTFLHLPSYGYSNDPISGNWTLAISIPHWFINLGVWLSYYLLRRKTLTHPKGSCQQCGYDLTGNESGVCPECNAEVIL